LRNLHSRKAIISAPVFTSYNRANLNYLLSELAIPDAINNMLIQGEKVNAVESNKTWLDVVYPGIS
jgi:hypothetical protein